MSICLYLHCSEHLTLFWCENFRPFCQILSYFSSNIVSLPILSFFFPSGTPIMELLNLSFVSLNWFLKYVILYCNTWSYTLGEFLSIMFQFSNYVFNHTQLRVWEEKLYLTHFLLTQTSLVQCLLYRSHIINIFWLNKYRKHLMYLIILFLFIDT